MVYRVLFAAVIPAALSAGGCVSLPSQTAPVDPARLVGQWRGYDFTGPYAADFESMTLNLAADGSFESGTRFHSDNGTSLDGRYRIVGRKIILDDTRGFRVTLPFHFRPAPTSGGDCLTVLRPSRLGRVRVTLRRYLWKPPKEDDDDLD